MRMTEELRLSLEHEIQRLLDIANGERESERVDAAVKLARNCRPRKGITTTRSSCLEAVREQAQHARTLLKSWVDSERNYSCWNANNQALFTQVMATVADTSYTLAPNFGDDEEDEPALTRGYSLHNSRGWERDPVGRLCRFQVHWSFVDLLRNLLRDDVAACDRCGKWYLNRSGHRNKRFCQRRCAVLDSVTRSVRKRRKQNREEKLRRARAAIRDCRPGRGDWRLGISKQTGLNVKFLTRALNRGDLKPPAGI